MYSHNYFQHYSHYFWQWEEAGEVLAIPNGSTIAYRPQVAEILEHLAPYGLPRFGSLLLAILATNPSGGQSVDAVAAIMRNEEGTHLSYVTETTAFLRLLSEIPAVYKTGEKRIILFRALFENCHNKLALGKSKAAADLCRLTAIAEQLEFPKVDKEVLSADFKVIAILGNKFKSVDDILQKMASVPDIEENILIEDTETGEVPAGATDLVGQLEEHYKTFHIGALIRRIWSGLNIPFHSMLPSQQPLGGVSDLTNKGDFDKLLISEFANDDLVFLNRIANNEALYIHREIPPENNNLERVILIDISLKNWGTPKIIAYAVMLAIATHPKTDITCRAFVFGDQYHPIDITSIHGIIAGLQLLEGCLHSAKGFEAFFREFPGHKDREVFVITTREALEQPAMLKAVNDHNTLINYWIHTDAEGAIDVYKKQQNSKRHIQHLLLPLNELWKKPPSLAAGERSSEAGNKARKDYPLLFNNTMGNSVFLNAADGMLFQVTREKALLRQFSSAVPHQKGWELLFEKVGDGAGLYEVGRLKNGEYLLFSYSSSSKHQKARLFNLTKREEVPVDFQLRSPGLPRFVAFANDLFYFRNRVENYSIDAGGNVEQVPFPQMEFNARALELKQLRESRSYSTPVFKNMTSVCINNTGNLTFKAHELTFRQDRIFLDTTYQVQPAAIANRTSKGVFTFDDGSVVEIHRYGMIRLRSSSENIPTIFIPSNPREELGVATPRQFAGNAFYYKEPLVKATIHEAGRNPYAVAQTLHLQLGMDRDEAQKKLKFLPFVVSEALPKSTAKKLQSTLHQLGTRLGFETVDEDFEPLKIISPETFYKKYISPFIQHIVDHGTKH